MPVLFTELEQLLKPMAALDAASIEDHIGKRAPFTRPALRACIEHKRMNAILLVIHITVE